MPTRSLKRKAKVKVELSSGNVYADLGLPNADEHLAKADLVIRVYEIITKRGLTQRDAARLLGIDQPKVSALLRGKFDGFSTDRLFRFLNRLGQDVTIVITPSDQETATQATTRVVGRTDRHVAAKGRDS